MNSPKDCLSGIRSPLITQNSTQENYPATTSQPASRVDSFEKDVRHQVKKIQVDKPSSIELPAVSIDQSPSPTCSTEACPDHQTAGMLKQAGNAILTGIYTVYDAFSAALAVLFSPALTLYHKISEPIASQRRQTQLARASSELKECYEEWRGHPHSDWACLHFLIRSKDRVDTLMSLEEETTGQGSDDPFVLSLTAEQKIAADLIFTVVEETDLVLSRAFAGQISALELNSAHNRSETRTERCLNLRREVDQTTCLSKKSRNDLIVRIDALASKQPSL
jgi:hypothetical protein